MSVLSGRETTFEMAVKLEDREALVPNDDLILTDETSKYLESLSKTEIRDLIQNMQDRALAGDINGEIIESPIEHYFSKDVYAREMRVPKGAVIIGKIHRYQNLNILSQGEVSVISIDGIKKVKAPYTFVASPGAKRLFYIHEDSVWTVIHGTAETDVDKIEQTFIAPTYDDLEQIEASTVEQIASVETEVIVEEPKCLG